MLTVILASGGFTCWLVTARSLFQRWRGHVAGKRDCTTHGTVRGRWSGCCYDEALVSDGEAASYAMAAALAFPLVWAAAIVRWKPGMKPRLFHRPRKEISR